MKRPPVAVFAAGLGFLLGPGCALPDPPDPSGGPLPLRATGVTVRLAVDGGTLTARGRELSFEPGAAALVLSGDAEVFVDGGWPFEARAERIDLGPDSALLEGGVRARFAVSPEAAEGDADAGR